MSTTPDADLIALAEQRLQDEPLLAGRANELAEYLQSAIEDWIADMKEDPDND